MGFFFSLLERAPVANVSNKLLPNIEKCSLNGLYIYHLIGLLFIAVIKSFKNYPCQSIYRRPLSQVQELECQDSDVVGYRSALPRSITRTLQENKVPSGGRKCPPLVSPDFDITRLILLWFFSFKSTNSN